MVTTRDLILELRQQDPKIKAVRMSEQLGITREAVRQNLVKLELSTNFWQPIRHCIDCGKSLGYFSTKNHRCRSCWRKAHHTTLVCDGCGKTYGVLLYIVKRGQKYNKHHFCSHSCASKWLTSYNPHFGFKRRERE